MALVVAEEEEVDLADEEDCKKNYFCGEFVFWEQKFQEANEIASLKVCPHFNELVVTITKLIMQTVKK